MLRGIRSRLLALVLATVVPFVALIGGGLWAQWRNAEAAAMQRSIVEARLIAAQIDDHISNMQNLLAGLNPAVSQNPADREANDALLRNIKAELPDIVSNILLFAPDGQNIGVSWGNAIARINASERRYFRQALAGQRLAVGEAIRSLANGEWVVTVARPVEDRSGRVLAVLAVGTRLEHIADALRLGDLPAGSLVRIVDDNGIVLFQSGDGQWIGRKAELADDVGGHLAGAETSGAMRWSDGVERTTGSSPAHQVRWIVSVGLPPGIAFAAVAPQLGWSLLLSVGALMAALAIAGVLSARIVQPLRQLRRDASVLAAGTLNHRTAVDTPDEVGALAATFNQMAASLERRHEEASRAADEIRQAKDTLSAVIDASPVATVCSDLERRIVLWSRAAEEMFGFTPAEVLGLPTKLLPPDGAARSQALFERAIAGETVRDVQVKRMRQDGSQVDVRIAAARMYDVDGAVRGVAWAYQDITERKRAEDRLEHLAHYDQLTGLPNRLSLQKELKVLLADAGRRTSIALFDLDGFKDVNDTLGHSTGDELLIEVGRRLADVARGRATVCRLGGDEFVVIVPDCGDPLTIGDIVDRMLRRLAEPIEVSDHVLHVGGSAGMAIAPDDGATVDELIANADLALYRAKSDGGRTCRFFMPVLRAQARARRELDVELRRAFRENELELFFQPQIRLADRAVVGAEALLRWRHPLRGILAPGAFIDTLADSAIAHAVGAWILETACARTAAWRARGLPLGRIGVNLFPTHLHCDELIDDVERALGRAGLPAGILELEITENVALTYEASTPTLEKLHERGVKLAFDDFGTGYASLSNLTRFPLTRIKIDRSFVGAMTEDPRDAAIARSLIAMAHNLGLAVIAEGVETEAQAAFLLEERCEEAQGFLFARPLSADAFEAYLRHQRIAGEPTGPADGTLPVLRPAAKPRPRRKLRGV